MKTKLLTICITLSFFFYTLASIKFANATGMDYYMDDSYHGYGGSSGGNGFLLLIIFAIIIAAFVYIKDFINQHGTKKIMKTGSEIFLGCAAGFAIMLAFVFFLIWISP